jgi:hypothetical protein
MARTRSVNGVAEPATVPDLKRRALARKWRGKDPDAAIKWRNLEVSPFHFGA